MVKVIYHSIEEIKDHVLFYIKYNFLDGDINSKLNLLCSMHFEPYLILDDNKNVLRSMKMDYETYQKIKKRTLKYIVLGMLKEYDDDLKKFKKFKNNMLNDFHYLKEDHENIDEKIKEIEFYHNNFNLILDIMHHHKF